MTTKNKFTYVLTIVCLTLPLATMAAKPDSGGGTFFYPDDPLVDCGDFWILDDTIVRVAWADFYDKEGNWVRSSAKYSFDDELFHEDFPDGIRLTGNAQVNHQWYVEDNEIAAHRVTGLPIGITVPGYGALFFEAGQLLFVDGELVFVAGKNKDFNQQDVDAICDYFGNQ